MAVFRSHREAARANNRVILRFFGVIAIFTLLFVAALAGRYLLGWW